VTHGATNSECETGIGKIGRLEKEGDEKEEEIDAIERDRESMVEVYEGNEEELIRPEECDCVKGSDGTRCAFCLV
jgi:hypothetical protein